MIGEERRRWTFLTNHARVLIVISKNPDMRARDIADITGITERSTQRIIADLEAAGYLSHERIGRRNRYRIKAGGTLRHPLEQGVEVGLLLDMFSDTAGADSGSDLPLEADQSFYL